MLRFFKARFFGGLPAAQMEAPHIFAPSHAPNGSPAYFCGCTAHLPALPRLCQPALPPPTCPHCPASASAPRLGGRAHCLPRPRGAPCLAAAASATRAYTAPPPTRRPLDNSCCLGGRLPRWQLHAARRAAPAHPAAPLGRLPFQNRRLACCPRLRAALTRCSYPGCAQR